VPLRLRKKVGKMMSLKRNVPFTVHFLGAIYSGETGNHVDDKMYLYGRSEAPTLRLIQTLLKSHKRATGKASTFIDVGVNSGVHMVCGAVCADKAYGFEPWDKVRAVAQKNLDANHAAHAKIFPFGLSDKNDTLPFLRPAHTNLGMGAFVRGSETDQKIIQDTTGVDLKDAIPLEVRNGDEVMRENAIDPTVIKIDTEGFEKFVLSGMKDTLAASRPAVIFEYSEITKGYLPNRASFESVFPQNYEIFGILRSREYPRLRPYSADAKFENLLAIPLEKLSYLNKL
jgi:FkbM family methyltransferase